MEERLGERSTPTPEILPASLTLVRDEHMNGALSIACRDLRAVLVGRRRAHIVTTEQSI